VTPFRLEKTVLECPEPRALAEFYAALLDMQVLEHDDGWVVIGREPGTRELAFQRPDRWQPPGPWPDGAAQLHLDLHVDDVEEATEEVLARGATRAPGAPETGYGCSSTRSAIRSAWCTDGRATQTRAGG
jgi:hypothetical protein